MYHVGYSDCYYHHHNTIVVEVPGDRRHDHHRGFWFSASPIRFVSPFVDKNYSGILNRATELLHSQTSGSFWAQKKKGFCVKSGNFQIFEIPATSRGG